MASIVRRAYSKHHREVEKLRQQANCTCDALLCLVDLKLKEVNAFEASLSSQQQENTARQAEETSRKEQTFMTFTTLPLSFMAAFFAINFEKFPKNSDGSSHLTLGWVSKYLFGISVAVSLPFIVLALNLARLSAWFAVAWMLIRPPLSPAKQLAWSGFGLSQLPLGAPILQVRTNEELKKMK
ncbi:hypothetical protein BGZ57DRAFT_920816 [Hyaloscypha finlandica]|nr:hypothetical protein BGZ57DRAFT_920816 [Hyaloscypha finlandica]